MKDIYYPTTGLLYEALKEITPEFALNESLALYRFCFEDTNGKQFAAYSMFDFCDEFNKRFGKTLEEQKCQLAGMNSYLITYAEKEKVGESAEEVVVVVEKVEKAVQEEENLEETIEEETPLAVDWSKASAFKDKNKLEEYAREFNVELSKRKTLGNMVKQFKAAMEDK